MLLTVMKAGAVNLLLSTDNVLVIALLSQALSGLDRMAVLSVSLIASAGFSLAILFVMAYLFHVRFLRALFGLLIVYMALRLLRHRPAPEGIDPSPSTWLSAGKIVAGNLMMSFENDATLIALAHGDVWLAWTAILVTSPLIFFGSHLTSWLIQRFDAVLYVGSVALFKIGVGLIFTLPSFRPHASLGVWGLTGLFGLVAALTYLSRSHGSREQPGT